jgi:chromosome segregation protein
MRTPAPEVTEAIDALRRLKVIGRGEPRTRRVTQAEIQTLMAYAGDQSGRGVAYRSFDLVEAKASLERIVQRINIDSRQLFLTTLETIRGHFQELFRKLFGGGMADIVLEDEADILESGIEIIARPPGKELRSISLMSGGEKTMTAVALLLAIFRSKPSPFCILDEVDAALDEANIGRFTAVLREFLDRSQFILITHSKKTMACADVLYGITMQESGISKRVAVRFEDWPDDERPLDAGADEGEDRAVRGETDNQHAEIHHEGWKSGGDASSPDRHDQEVDEHHRGQHEQHRAREVREVLAQQHRAPRDRTGEEIGDRLVVDFVGNE